MNLAFSRTAATRLIPTNPRSTFGLWHFVQGSACAREISKGVVLKEMPSTPPELRIGNADTTELESSVTSILQEVVSFNS